MQYVISFLEGIITFISPCLLPMLPLYISYFAGGGRTQHKKNIAGCDRFCDRIYDCICYDGSAGGNGRQFSERISDCS